MTQNDMADFLAGERASIESVLGNLRLVRPRIQNEAVRNAMYYWIETLDGINRHIAITCDRLRKNQL